VLLVDDISETAGTLTSAAKICQENGALRIFAGVSHAVLGEVGQERIANSDIEELVSTDSTPYAVGDKVTAVSVAELLGEAIRRIHLEESVTSLFDIS
jgi:ribose-phosphate pyrophosphokinase